MTPHPQQHHTFWYRVRKMAVVFFSGLGFAMVGVAVIIAIDKVFDPAPPSIDTILRSPVEIEVKSVYKFHPEDGVVYKEIKNVGLTYYSRNDGFTPGVTARSGRFVYEGAIAVSQPLWQKEVAPGDLIFVKATGKWYKAEDTMHSKYTEARVDIYTHYPALASSGSSKTDIIIVRQPK